MRPCCPRGRHQRGEGGEHLCLHDERSIDRREVVVHPDRLRKCEGAVVHGSAASGRKKTTPICEKGSVRRADGGLYIVSV